MPKNLAFIGSGNMARFLGNRFLDAGQTISQVISPTAGHARMLADQWGCSYSESIRDLSPETDVVIMAVRDDVIRELGQTLRVPETVVIHTAGAVSSGILKPISSHYGTLWCIYSIHQDHLPEHREIPLVWEASDETSAAQIETLASYVSDQLVRMDEAQKSLTHLCAVFANNFTNHLLSICHQLTREAGIPESLLLPLILDTLHSSGLGENYNGQTGPAIRRDTNTLNLHRNLLETHPEWKTVYNALTASIQAMYPEK